MMTPDKIVELVEKKQSYLAHNFQLIDIFEGNLQCYIDAELKRQLSAQTYQQAMFRLSPVNILPKVIDKLTNIYQTSVNREVIGGTEADDELLDWASDSMEANVFLNTSNELYNLCKTSLIYPYAYKDKPKIRVIQNDRFVAYSDDQLAPHIPTQITIFGDMIDGVAIYWTWDAQSFMISDSNGDLRRDLMAKYDNYDGINPIGRLPFVYVNESKNKLYPTIDTDTLKMVKVLPVMLTDLNVAAMFQSFAIIYGIDVDFSELKFAPNVVWSAKSDPTTDKKPEVGTIKPQVDYDQVLGLIQSQLSMWLSSKGIRASSIGTLTQDNFASGISKVIDEMDTYEARQKQVEVYKAAEKDLWDLVLHDMLPYWQQTGQISNRAVFSPSATVDTQFAVQLPMQSRGAAVAGLKEEYAAGFISRKRAIAKLNPDMGADDVDELIKEIDEERGFVEISDNTTDQGAGESDQGAAS